MNKEALTPFPQIRLTAEEQKLLPAAVAKYGKRQMSYGNRVCSVMDVNPKAYIHFIKQEVEREEKVSAIPTLQVTIEALTSTVELLKRQQMETNAALVEILGALNL